MVNTHIKGQPSKPSISSPPKKKDLGILMVIIFFVFHGVVYIPLTLTSTGIVNCWYLMAISFGNTFVWTLNSIPIYLQVLLGRSDVSGWGAFLKVT